MIKPISLRPRYTEAIERARTTLIRAGRGDELKRADSARVMRQARAIVERRQEQDGLHRFLRALPPGGLAHARPDDLEAFPSGLGHAASGTTYLLTR